MEMNASTAKIIGIVLVVLLAVGLLKFMVLIPFGIAGGVFHGDLPHWFDRGDAWLWPVAGLGGLLVVLLLAFTVWVLFWVYKDAESRGLQGILWVLLVFFLHLLGLVIYLLVRSGHPVKTAAPAPGPTAPVPPSSTAPTAPPVPPAPFAPQPPPVPSVTPSCAKCGKPVHSGWVACPHCGEKL
jgi:hypothetical protein